MRLWTMLALAVVVVVAGHGASANPGSEPSATPRIINKAAAPGAAASGSPPTEAPPPAAATDAVKPQSAPAAQPASPYAPVAKPGKPGDGATDKTAETPPPAPSKPVAKAPPKPRPVTLVARIDLSSQRMTVSANGKELHTWAISSGAAGYETPTGSFRPTRTEEIWHSTQYDDAPMPHSVFFNGGIATHATNATRRLGSPASHGCVRLAPRNAERFYELVQKHGLRGTSIVVVGKTPASSVNVARRQRRDRYDDDGSWEYRRRREMERRPRYLNRYGWVPPSERYYEPPPRMVFPGDRPRRYERW